jgi:hypothetical protein
MALCWIRSPTAKRAKIGKAYQPPKKAPTGAQVMSQEVQHQETQGHQPYPCRKWMAQRRVGIQAVMTATTIQWVIPSEASEPILGPPTINPHTRKDASKKARLSDTSHYRWEITVPRANRGMRAMHHHFYKLQTWTLKPPPLSVGTLHDRHLEPSNQICKSGK